MFVNKLIFILIVCFISASQSEEFVRTIIYSDRVITPIGPYSHAVQIGSTVYVSLTVGVSREGVIAEGIANQTRLALDNIGFILEEAGSSFNNVITTTLLIGNVQDFGTVNAIYAEYFPIRQPARSFRIVPNLQFGALVAFDAMAIVGQIIEADEISAASIGVGKEMKYFVSILCLLLMTTF